MFHPLCITSRAKGTMNGTVNGQETYRRILVIRKEVIDYADDACDRLDGR